MLTKGSLRNNFAQLNARIQEAVQGLLMQSKRRSPLLAEDAERILNEFEL